jgi:hypothetical protein
MSVGDRRRFCWLTAAFLLSLPLLAVGCGKGLDRSKYVARNSTLYESLPRASSAAKVEQRSVPYRTKEDGPIGGYTTLTILRVPRRTSLAQIVAFYRTRLPAEGWILVERLDGPVLNFKKARASVSVNLESFRERLVEIAVDYDGAAKGESSGA